MSKIKNKTIENKSLIFEFLPRLISKPVAEARYY